MSNVEVWHPERRLVHAVTLLITACALAPLEGRAAEPANDEANRFVQERFQRLDTNGDGKLSAAEVGSRRLFQRMDADGDGFVTKEEANTFFGNVANTLQDRFGQRIGSNGDTNSATAVDDTPHEGPRPLKASEHGVGTLAPNVAFTDLDGKQWRLSDFKKHKALVVAMTSTSCPLSKKYAPALARLEKKYREKDVAFLFVNAVSSDKKEEMRAAVKTHGFAGPYVPDATGSVAKALGALVTTDVLVLDSARTLIYHGAFDDQYGLAYSFDAPRRRYLEEALESVLAGRVPAVAATTAPGCALDLSQAKTPAPAAPVTYHNRISRIVQNNCTECHHNGGVAPFALETHEDVVGHAGMIRKQVERGAMPPWFAAPAPAGDHTQWANERSLSARDKKDLLAWLDQGRPIGDPADAPLPREYPAEWEIGQPDAIVQIPTPISVKAEGTMAYQNVNVTTTFTEDKWVRAIEV
jgi:peroxiredoxin/mono/diheme cytochrome c family protein